MFIKRRRIFLLTNDINETLPETLRVMKNSEASAINNKDFQTLILTLFITTDNIYFDVWQFVRQNINYKLDKKDETVISPLQFLGLKYGDCDDMALFVKSVFSVFGIESFYLLLGRQPGLYTHIVVYSNGYVIDPTNSQFNSIPDVYKFQKIVKEF